MLFQRWFDVVRRRDAIPTYIQRWTDVKMFAGIKLQNWKFAYLCGLLMHNCNNNKMGRCITISGIKERFFDSSTVICICLHSSSSDSSSFVYTRLVTLLHSSVFVFTCLHLSPLVLWLISVFRIDRIFHIFESFSGCKNIVKCEFKTPVFFRSTLYHLHEPLWKFRSSPWHVF